MENGIIVSEGLLEIPCINCSEKIIVKGKWSKVKGGSYIGLEFISPPGQQEKCPECGTWVIFKGNSAGDELYFSFFLLEGDKKS